MKKTIQSYINKLNNLTSNNRLLTIFKCGSDNEMDFHDLNLENGLTSHQILNLILFEKKSIKVCQIIDPRDKSQNLISQKLNKIYRKRELIADETGSCQIYIGYPFIEGKFLDGNIVRCPLILWQINLKKIEKNWVINIDDEVESKINETFLLAYQYHNNIKLNNIIDENNIHNSILDFKNNLYQSIKNSAIEVNFNQKIFENNLDSIENKKKNDLENEFINGNLKLENKSIFGIFNQSNINIIKDYEAININNKYHDIEEIFLERNNVNINNEGKENLKYLVFDVDISQENAINEIKKGKSIVVQGPPGTGKSQLISNLILDYCSNGKKVLVISQKKAALEVVYNRLKEVNVENFTAIVDDYQNDKSLIFQKLLYQINNIDEYILKNKELERVFLERDFENISNQIETITLQLDQYKSILFDQSFCGISIKELYLNTKKTKNKIDLENNYIFFKPSEIGQFEFNCEKLLHFSFDLKTSFWINRKYFSSFGMIDLSKINMILDEIILLKSNKIEIEILKSYLEIIDNNDFKIELDTIIKNPFLNLILDDNLKTTIENYYNEIDNLLNNQNELFFSLINLKNILNQAFLYTNNNIKWTFWKLTNSDKSNLLKNIFETNNIKFSNKNVIEFQKKIDSYFTINQKYESILNSNFDLINIDYLKKDKEFEKKKQWISTKKEKNKFKIIDQINNSNKNENIETSIETLNNYYFKLIEYFSKNQIKEMIFKNDNIQNLQDEINIYFNSFKEFDLIYNQLNDIEKITFDQINKFETLDNKIEIFKNSLNIHWINHIEQNNPMLNIVSSNQIGVLESKLQELIIKKQKICQEIITIRLRENTYQKVEYNRLGNKTTYRNLEHQCQKKRLKWPLRKIFSEFGNEIFDLIPCWMTSPENVSALFELLPIFDLVIFDEASQCFSEKGIPSILRGKQVVIAGDSKQLQPHDLYSPRWEDDENDNVETQIDSLLDLSCFYLPQVMLKSHYRSKDQHLIEFSNQYFYDKKLELLPDYLHFIKKEKAIEYIKVEGYWKDNSNLIEAQKVCEVFQYLHQKNPEKSIGIITFNSKQQLLIKEMINQKMANENWQKINYFVKNIENVQGDESDNIILSLGYAKGNDGKLRANFGSLNLEGGENRLNVTITRAKEKIMIISSFLPNELNVENATNQGPKLLKKYLEFAYNIDQKIELNISKSENYDQNQYLKYQIKNENSNIVLDQFNFVDASISSNNDIKLILTDDQLYHHSISAKESHGYLPIKLKNKNWKFIRIYSQQYWDKKIEL